MDDVRSLINPVADGDVFRALADESRRALLDALFEHDGQRLTELCAVLPSLTRFGVMKHLGVLEAAGLIVTERVGRDKWHHLNAVPIQQISQRWLSKYSATMASVMIGIRDAVEQTEHARTSRTQAPTQAPIQAPIQAKDIA